MVRTLPLILPLLAFAQAVAQPAVMKFTLAGAEVGQNTYERKADGAFTSSTTLNILGQKISSVLTGRFSGTKLVSYRLEESSPAAKGYIRYANGSYTAEAGGSKNQGKVKITTSALFANYHPQMASTIAQALSKSQATSQNMRVFIMDSLVQVPFPVAFRSSRKANAGDKEVALKILSVEAGAVTVDYPIGPNNVVVGMDVPVQRFQGVLEGYTGVYEDPVSKYPELSQPTHTTKRLVKQMIPMRDGVRLAADVVMPAEDGKYPVILSRTPYGRESQLIGAEWWAKRGYVVVAQDVRGKQDSEGVFNPFMNERKDGYDTIDWISKQPWCDGNVGMIGASYVGMVQWQAAVERHPALKAIVPQVSPPDAFFNVPYDNGVFFLWGSLWWSNIVRGKSADMAKVTAGLKDAKKLTTLPLSKVDDRTLGANIPWFNRWLKMDRASDFKGFNFQSDMKSVEIPALHISGWWDGDGIGTKMNWAAMARAGRTNQWLIYGPWTHAFNTSTRMGDVAYGQDAILELDSLYLRWFDTWLKGKSVGLEDKQPRVKAFLMGANKWLDLKGWPDPSARQETLYLDVPKGSAAGPRSSGVLVERPPAKRAPSKYVYDPRKVVIPKELLGQIDVSGGSTVIKLDRKAKDVLVYRSAPMKEDMDVTGPVELDLKFSTSAKDTDFFVMLLDVDPKGVMRAVAMPGKIRAKYLFGWDTPKLLTPGKTYTVKIPIWDTANRFKKGHRIGIMIQSQMFPIYARNLNTGESYYSGTRMVTARQAIYHDASRPSALRFFVLPRQGG